MRHLIAAPHRRLRLPAVLGLLLVSLSGAFSHLRAQTESSSTSPLSPSTVSPGALQADRVLPDASYSTRATLAGHRPAWATPAADRGTLPDSQCVQLVFALARDPQVQAAFLQLLSDQQNPSSPRFHQWLTPQQVGEQYGPTQHDLDALTTWLTGKGFTIDAVQPSRIFLQVSAPAAVIAAALETSLHNFASISGDAAETLQGPINDPSVPLALRPIVAYIGGLTSVPLHTFSHAQVITSTASAGADSKLHPNLTTSSTNHYLTPGDFATIYDVNAVYNAGVRGSGEKVMILGGSRLNPSDIAYWASDTAQASYTPNYIVGSGFTDPGQTSDSNQGEATLDFERVYGTAPGATVDMVIAQNWLSGTVNTNLILYAINTVNDPILSLSFGSCEYEQTTSYVQYEDSIYSQAAAQGISVFVSSGDSGVTGCATHGAAASTGTQQISINDVCASSYVTCVGGTEFNDTANPASYWSSTNGTGFSSALSYIPEGGWNEPTTTNSSGVVTGYVVAASGGGPSTVIAKPSWQTGTGVPPDGARDTPDVSFSAAGHDGYFACLAYANGSCVPITSGPNAGGFSFIAFGGTSASAPSMAGIAALLDGKLGARQGNLNPVLYANAAKNPQAFHDAALATSGVSGCSAATPSMCNNSAPAPATLTGGVAGYLLGTGYDLVTGLGSLDVNAFISDASGTTLATSVSLTASPSVVSTATQFVLTAKIAPTSGSGTPDGSVSFTSNGSALGSAVALANGSASTPSLLFPTAGTYLISATYSGSGTYATSSATLSLVVTAPALPATSTSLSITPIAPNTQGTITLGSTVTPTQSGSSNTPTGTVQFSRTTGGSALALGTPVVLTAGKASIMTTLPAGTYPITAAYSGDTNFAGSSASQSIVVTAVPTLSTLSSAPSSVTSTTILAPIVTVTTGGTGTPTGSVLFLVDGVASSSVPLSNGSARATAFFLAPGTHMLSATYSGDNVFASSNAVPVSIVSSVTSTATSVSVSASTLSTASALTLAGTVSNVVSAVPTSALVTLKDGATVLGTAPLSAGGLSASFTFTVAPNTLPTGSQVITASFAGDTNYGASSSNASTVTVTQAPYFTLAAASPSLTLASASAASGSDVITATTSNAFSGTISFGCSVTPTAGVSPSCTLSAPTIAFPGTTSTTVTIGTIAPHDIPVTNASSRFKPLRGLLAFAGLLLFCLPARNRVLRRRLRVATIASVLLLCGVLTALSGCGNSFTTRTPSGGTTTGAYTVTVTGASTTGILPTAATFTVTVN